MMVQNLFAKWCGGCFRDIGLEPGLEPLSGEVFESKSAKKEDEARSDVRVRLLGELSERIFRISSVLPPCP